MMTDESKNRAWFHVVMLSGGQLRHYETLSENFLVAYIDAQKEDTENYGESNCTNAPDATVIRKDCGTSYNFYKIGE